MATSPRGRGRLEVGRITPAAASPERIRSITDTGTPDDWFKEAEAWRARGATHLTVNTMDAGLRGPDARIKRLEQAIQALRPNTPSR